MGKILKEAVIFAFQLTAIAVVALVLISWASNAFSYKGDPSDVIELERKMQARAQSYRIERAGDLQRWAGEIVEYASARTGGAVAIADVEDFWRPKNQAIAGGMMAEYADVMTEEGHYPTHLKFHSCLGSPVAWRQLNITHVCLHYELLTGDYIGIKREQVEKLRSFARRVR